MQNSSDDKCNELPFNDAEKNTCPEVSHVIKIYDKMK